MARKPPPKMPPELIPKGGNTGAPPMQMNFTQEAINSAIDMTCQNELKFNDKDETQICNGEIFIEAARLKYINPIMSPTGQQTVATVNIGKMCVKCGAVFSPDQWLKKHNEEQKATKGTVLEK